MESKNEWFFGLDGVLLYVVLCTGVVLQLKEEHTPRQKNELIADVYYVHWQVIIVPLFYGEDIQGNHLCSLCIVWDDQLCSCTLRSPSKLDSICMYHDVEK